MSKSFLPAKVKVLEVTYGVEECADHFQRGPGGNTDLYHGQFQINRELKPEGMLRALWYDIARAGQKALDLQGDDQAARHFAVIVNSVLADNPELVKCYLQGKGMEE